jgi:hypothetical protein
MMLFASQPIAAPMVNLTNVQSEVFLPFSGSGGFYRLKTP